MGTSQICRAGHLPRDATGKWQTWRDSNEVGHSPIYLKGKASSILMFWSHQLHSWYNKLAKAGGMSLQHKDDEDLWPVLWVDGKSWTKAQHKYYRCWDLPQKERSEVEDVQRMPWDTNNSDTLIRAGKSAHGMPKPRGWHSVQILQNGTFLSSWPKQKSSG